MSKACKLFLVGLLACVVILPSAASAQPAGGVKPNICRTECDGSWGAVEHSKVDAEGFFGEPATVDKCEETGVDKHWYCKGTTPGYYWSLELEQYGRRIGEIGYNSR
jgi:hypothetical protein